MFECDETDVSCRKLADAKDTAEYWAAAYSTLMVKYAGVMGEAAGLTNLVSQYRQEVARLRAQLDGVPPE